MFLDFLTVFLFITVIFRIFLSNRLVFLRKARLVADLVSLLLVFIYLISLAYLLYFSSISLNYLLFFLVLTVFLILLQNLGSQIFLKMALAFLALIPLLIVVRVEKIAEAISIIAYFFLVLGFVGQLISKEA